MKNLIHIAAEYFGVPDEAVTNPVYRDKSSLTARYAVAQLLSEKFDMTMGEIAKAVGYANATNQAITRSRHLMRTKPEFYDAVESIRNEWDEQNRKKMA